MFSYKKLIKFKITIVFILFSSISYADNHNLYEVLELIQKDLKTLEKAVYSGSLDTIEKSKNSNEKLTLDNNAEDVLTRHLLRLSEIEVQFQQLTNKFEEINFKLDKLSSRLSKVQADNQVRFQDIENSTFVTDDNKKISTNQKKKSEKILAGSSEPQETSGASFKLRCLLWCKQL